MKKYFIIFCSLLIMIISLFFVSPVHALSGTLANQQSIDYYNFYTSIDNLQMIYLNQVTQDDSFFTSSTNSFPRTDNQTISGSCRFDENSNVVIQYDSKFDPFYSGYLYDTMINYSNFGQDSYVHHINCFYGEFFMPINRQWNNKNNELRYLVEYSENVEFEVYADVWGYYPVLLETGFYMQPFEIRDIYVTFPVGDTFEFSLTSILTDYADISQYIHNNFLYITRASIDMGTASSIEKVITGFSYYFNKIENSNLPTIKDFQVSIDIDISPFGTALFNSVTNFLKFEIIPGFSLLDLLFYVVAVPLLIAILKIFLGG